MRMWIRILDLGSFLTLNDPGSGIRDGKNSEPGSGINIRNPQHCLKGIKSAFYILKCWNRIMSIVLEPDYVYILEGYGISQIGTDNMDCQRKQFKFQDRMEILSFFALRIRTQKRIETCKNCYYGTSWKQGWLSYWLFIKVQ
jgi:hypothetical protein